MMDLSSNACHVRLAFHLELAILLVIVINTVPFIGEVYYIHEHASKYDDLPGPAVVWNLDSS